MRTLPETILYQSRRLPEGGLLTPKEFLHLGSRAAVDQAFSRLAKAGLLVRAARGLYVAPVSTAFGMRMPSVDKTLKSLAHKTQETITDSGARAANALGLTTQVPVREVYLTNGRGRTLSLNKATVEIRRAPRWMLLFGSALPGTAIRALGWLGEAHVVRTMKKLHKLLSPGDWQELRSIRHLLPAWMAQAISREVAWGG
ncbi:type IV toxin-antitoxin system AbiEi family antitoxin domain-containing protein [Pseudomonas sp. CrR14]|nr:type IV toxin-antitoxin system AbiEi family antitoxin domain-containing protein [Pseudomonas sp. CrR14]